MKGSTTCAASKKSLAAQPESLSIGPTLKLQRPCACGGNKAPGFSGKCEDCRKQNPLGLQAKLKIGASNDPYEQEADCVADGVLGDVPRPTPMRLTPVQQQRCPVSVQRRGVGVAGDAPVSVQQAIASHGQGLGAATRSFYESRFGYDFSEVRIHTGTTAERSAREVQARAYTVGHDIVFGAGEYAPGTAQGRHLLAHELAHVVQQSAAPEAAVVQRAPAAGAANASGGVRYDSMPLEEAIGHLHEMTPEQAAAVLRRWQKFISNSINQGEGQIREYIKLRAESFGNYLIGGTIEFFGGTSIPSDDWQEPWRLVMAAYAPIAKQQVKESAELLLKAAAATRRHWQQVHEFQDRSEAGADRSILALQALQVAGAAAITVLTAGQGTAGMVAAGAGYAGAQRFAGEGTEVLIGTKQRIDFAGIAFDMLFAALMGKFLGSFGGKVANSVSGAIIKRVGEGAAKQVLAKITAQFVASILVGRASGLAHGAALQVFNAVRGKKSLSVDDFIQMVADQISLQAAFLDMVGAATTMSFKPSIVAPDPPKPRLVKTPPVLKGGGGGAAPPVREAPPEPNNVIPLRRRGGGVDTASEPRALRGELGSSRFESVESAPTPEPRLKLAPAAEPVLKEAPVSASATRDSATATGGTNAQGAWRGGSGAPALAKPLPVTEPATAPQPVKSPVQLAPPAVGPGPAPNSTLAPTTTAINATVTQPKSGQQPKQKCPYPTGRTQKDPIPIQWFKPRSDFFYPAVVSIQGHDYQRDGGEQTLPHGEPFGVEEERWPYHGKILRLTGWDRRGRRARSDDYRGLLTDYGYRPRTGGLQVDHVQDPQWADPDDPNLILDEWYNLWPLSSDLNMSAGGRQNNTQTVSFCEGPNGPARTDVSIAQIKLEGRYGLYFVIGRIDYVS
jgi:hypothetical protein